VRTTRGETDRAFCSGRCDGERLPRNQRDSTKFAQRQQPIPAQLRLLELWFSNTSIDSFMSFTFWLNSLCSLCARRDFLYSRTHQIAKRVVSITSPKPTTSPTGTIHHPSTSWPGAGALPNPSLNDRSRSPLLSWRLHNSGALWMYWFQHSAQNERCSRKYPTSELMSTKNPATLRLAQRNKLARI